MAGNNAFFGALAREQANTGGLSGGFSFGGASQDKLAFAFSAAAVGNTQPLKDLGIDPKNLPKLASGTKGRPITGGMAIVGEAGPELINVTRRGVDVVPLKGMPGFAKGIRSLDALTRSITLLQNKIEGLRFAKLDKGNLRGGLNFEAQIPSLTAELNRQINELARMREQLEKIQPSEVLRGVERVASEARVSSETSNTINIVNQPEPQRVLREALTELSRSERTREVCRG
ncbi:MAG: hypothetical protein HC918_13700 [Oscillatoriales cyanobacterium SM2_1_8]|nr:hypothetical protein [Oscillatoriales cyanobacterium SM2_1_8]